MFTDECKEWRKKASVDKTWLNFKKEFNVAHMDLRESTLTARAGGYNQANYVGNQEDSDASEAYEAIQQLANATTADRETIATLTKTNEELTSEIVEVNKKLVVALEKLAKVKETPKIEYCWSCGHTCEHTGWECQKKKEGHKRNVTFMNKLGGATKKIVKEA